MRFHFGEVPAVEVTRNSVTIELAKDVHITLHIPNGFPLDVKVGDKIPLTAEIPIGRTYKD